ncbi:GntR family transcriptional regulator [Paenarthrobacter sp. FR1]|uniref:GntR family transcriptional regulator n=1 Tax=Paenarthrobacter sp. FR1 TaxID=3439548 RepID=UPI003DA6A99E
MAKTAVDRAYEWLRTEIMSGSLPAGTFIEETTVCEATGLSRTPVREAFHRLAGERYVNLVPRRGAQVHGLSATELYEVFDARLAIESHSLRELCERKVGVPIDMQRALDEMLSFRELKVREDFVEYGHLDIAFHRAGVEAIGNTLLLQVYDSLRPLHERSALAQARISGPPIRNVTTLQHQAIMKSLATHDAVGAVRALSEHLRPIPGVPELLEASA